MLRKSDWIIDTRPMGLGRWGKLGILTWEEWCCRYAKEKEQWLMSIIDTLLKNQDWAGSYLLVKTYINALKQREGVKGTYNRTPYNESPNVRAIRHWFWSMVEEHGFMLPEEDITYGEQDIEGRRTEDQKAAAAYPFVGGKPKRRYSESAEFFQQVEQDRNKERRPPLDAPRKTASGKTVGRPRKSYPVPDPD